MGRGPLGWITRDGKLILLARGLRNFAQGAATVLVAIYLDRQGFSLAQIGLFLTLGFAGGAGFAFLGSLVADSLGRRRLLLAFTLLGAIPGLALAATDRPLLLMVAAFLGSFGAAGGNTSPHLPVEQAALPATCSPQRRTDLFALYGVAGTAGASLGALAAGLPAVFQGALGLSEFSAYRAIFLGYAFLTLLGSVLYTQLSAAVEVTARGRRWANPLDMPSRRRIFTLAGLFGVDSFAGGFITQSLVSYWFFTRFGVQLEALAVIFFSSNLISALSQWVAAKLANRIGLVNTMVFTHIPASLFLLVVPFMPAAWLAVLFWQLRSFFSQMDVPTRQSYTMSVVAPEERSVMAGATTVSRGAGITAGPALATVLWNVGSAALPFVACGVLKIAYDLTLWALFHHLRPPEEVARAAARQAAAPGGVRDPR
jgi:MFS family permease